MKIFILSYWQELHSMGKLARAFFAVGAILFLFFLFFTFLLAGLSFYGSSLPWESWVGIIFSLLGRISVLFFSLSYISDYLFRQRETDK